MFNERGKLGLHESVGVQQLVCAIIFVVCMRHVMRLHVGERPHVPALVQERASRNGHVRV